MTPAEKQKLANLEAAVRYLADHAHGQARGQVRDILARQPEPVAPEEPVPCPDGHVPKLESNRDKWWRQCRDDHGWAHWTSPTCNTPEAATREWNRGMKR